MCWLDEELLALFTVSMTNTMGPSIVYSSVDLAFLIIEIKNPFCLWLYNIIENYYQYEIYSQLSAAGQVFTGTIHSQVRSDWYQSEESVRPKRV
jgi:hypothetical protein